MKKKTYKQLMIDIMLNNKLWKWNCMRYNFKYDEKYYILDRINDKDLEIQELMVFRRINKVSGKCLIDYQIKVKTNGDKSGFQKYIMNRVKNLG